MNTLELLEGASYVVTVFGLPYALLLFLYESRKGIMLEQEEEYQLLANAYNDFLKVVLENPDLRLRSNTPVQLTSEQEERKAIIFDMLIALFERAFLLAYNRNMSVQDRRRWNSWEDFMREWCRRPDFTSRLPTLLSGEDPEFAAYIQQLASEEEAVTLWP